MLLALYVPPLNSTFARVVVFLLELSTTTCGPFVPVPEPIPEAAVPEKAIIDEDRRKNAELIEEAFYQRKNLHPDMHDEKDKMIEVPENVDAMLLAKVLRDPEMAALITSMAKAIEKNQ